MLQLSSVIAKWNLEHGDIRPACVRLGFGVSVGADVVFVIAVLVRVLPVSGTVGRGIPKLTSTQ